MAPADRVELGRTGDSLASNMRRIRVVRELTLRDVADLLVEIGHPIAHSGLSKIENRTRRVDVDDLVAIALALNVSPLALLLPDVRNPSGDMAITGTAGTAQEIWEWAQGTTPLLNDVGLARHHEHETWTPEGVVAHAHDFLDLAIPWWQRPNKTDRAEYEAVQQRARDALEHLQVVDLDSAIPDDPEVADAG